MAGGWSGGCGPMRAQPVATTGPPQPQAGCDRTHDDTRRLDASARPAAPRAPGALRGRRLPGARVGPAECPDPHRGGARLLVRRVARRTALRAVSVRRLAGDLTRTADADPRDRDVRAVSAPLPRSAATSPRPPHRPTPSPSRPPAPAPRRSTPLPPPPPPPPPP